MIIKKFKITEGFFEKTFEFGDRNNLIFSKFNSSGKTTLLRCILYGLGYKIPPTKYFKFNKCTTELTLKETTAGDVQLLRNREDSIEVIYDSKSEIFILPEQHNKVLEIIYGIDNIELLNNILGAHYIDQEKGWTLLNRGVVIGSIHFNIEELVRGLGDKDGSDLLETQKKLKDKIEKYKHIQNIIEYKKSVSQNDYSFVPEEKNEQIINEINALQIRKNIINKKLNSIKKNLKENSQFKKFISEMNILVRDEFGKEIKVTSENIVGLNDSIDILITKQKMYVNTLIQLTKDIEKLEVIRRKEENQLSFFESIDPVELFDTTISRLPLNENVVKSDINNLQKELKSINEKLSDLSNSNNISVKSIIKSINKYAYELGLENSDNFGEKYLFTSNLKELSGAVLHKTVFAFKAAYILEIQNKLNIKLPIILDSPSGKEVDTNNIQKMMDILKNDFSENQIIIASIYQYSLPDIKNIEIKKRMIEE